MACAIDGEGCVDIWLNRGRFYPAVRITQTVLGWLEEIQKEWGGNICDVSSKNPKHAHKWRIVFRGEVLVTVLTEVGPYLRIKRQQAWLALELAERIINQTGTIRTRITREEREYRRTLYGRCRLLNKRGPRGDQLDMNFREELQLRLFDENGKRVAGDSEESIYQALGLPYQRPEDRR